MKHFPCALIVFDFIPEHFIIDESCATKSLCKQNLLFHVWVESELVRFVRFHFSPWLSIYFFITSIGAPPLLTRQNLLLQKYSFHNFCRISGNSFLISRLLALLYAFKNFVSSELGCAEKTRAHDLDCDSIPKEYYCMKAVCTQRFPVTSARPCHLSLFGEIWQPEQEHNSGRTQNGY